MTIESQLIETLRDRIKEGSTKARDIELIAHHFGFGGHPWPTLEETGQRFDDLTRERVRQIILRKFKRIITSADVPALSDCYELIKTRGYWRYSELEERIEKAGLAGDNFHIEGIFNLMNELGLTGEYQIYTPELQEQSRRHAVENADRFVIGTSVAKVVRPLYRRARRIPGQYGIARLDYLDDDSQEYSLYRPLIYKLLRSSKEAWVHERNGEVWYLFEDVDDNPIMNFSRKVFSVANGVDTLKLAANLHNALRGRTQSHNYPEPETLALYLENAKRFEKIGNRVQYRGPRERALSPIERDVVGYLESHGPTNYTDIRKYLEGRQHSSANINKTVNHSPLVYIDRSQGRGRYLYSLLESAESTDEPGRYVMIRRRLIALGGTDATSEAKARREQHILREWLFGEKTRDSCALCGEEYPVTALVAAHKKKRKDCSEVERLDPHIVMPLCLFGCDFLYEHRHVKVEGGVIRDGAALEDNGAGRHYLINLFGRNLGEFWWSNGSSSYFQ